MAVGTGGGGQLAALRKPESPSQVKAQAEALLQAMTPEERFDFVCGTGFGVRAVPRLGIPEMRFGDASAGLRLAQDEIKVHQPTAFPCTLTLAATWNAPLAREYGRAVAEEFRMEGKHFILGPGMNLYRNSKCGRNFEYFGEDPFLAAGLVAAYVRGAQSVDVGTSLKHFIGNETEERRRASNTIVDERTLHEIYLPPFVAGIRAGAWSIMTAYNAVNGEWAGQNHWLVSDLLRQQLGFESMVMTDWHSTWDGIKVSKSGVDLEMPYGHALKMDRAAVLGSSEVDRMAQKILETGIGTGIYQMESEGAYARPEWKALLPDHERLAYRVNLAGIVLLANNGVLPLAPPAPGIILVAGNAARQQELSGGGSGHVRGYNLTTYLDEVRKVFGGNTVVYSETPTDKEVRAAAKVLLFVGRPFNLKQGAELESVNHPFELPDDTLIDRCVRLNRNTIIVVTSGGGARMDWAGRAAAILLAANGGQTGPGALMAILTGAENPSGRLPFSIERSFADSCAAADDAAVKPGRILADPEGLVARIPTDNARRDFIKQDGQYYTYDLTYREGLFVGYRWYDFRRIQPRYPFGFGLSYTQFKYSRFRTVVDQSGSAPVIRLQFNLKNTGLRSGEEVAQVYVGKVQSGSGYPVRELKAFERVPLAPGETREVVLKLDTSAFARWQAESRRWEVEPGLYRIWVGKSSRDLPLATSIRF